MDEHGGSGLSQNGLLNDSVDEDEGFPRSSLDDAELLAAADAAIQGASDSLPNPGGDVDADGQLAWMGIDSGNMSFDQNVYKVGCRFFDVIQVSVDGLKAVLVCWKDREASFFSVELQDEWALTPLRLGDQVALWCDFDAYQEAVVLDRMGNAFLFIFPSCLVSTTVIASSFRCLRACILSDRIRAAFVPTAPLIVGDLVHSLFEQGLSSGRFFGATPTDGLTSTSEDISKLIKERILVIAAAGLTEESIFPLVSAYVPQMNRWAAQFCRKRRSAYSDALSPRTVQKSGPGAPELSVRVRSCVGVEQLVRVSSLGLQGKFDACVECEVFDDENEENALVKIPLELKTGKRGKDGSHLAQVMLYTLLLKYSLGKEVPFGLLCYLKEKDAMSAISRVPDEVRMLLIRRNEIAAAYVRHILPSVLQKSDVGASMKCRSCNVRGWCALLQWCSLFAAGKDPNNCANLFEDEFRVFSDSLGANDVAYFRHWTMLLDMEEQSMRKEEQEKLDKCGTICDTPQSSPMSPIAAMGIPRGNVVRLLSGSSSHCVKLRSRIVGMSPPGFGDLAVPHLDVSSSHLRSLNEDQICMIMKVLRAQDYALVLGMPGTGKTMATAAAIHLLAGRGYSVLVSAYTHAAVDALCVKLGKLGASFVRIGDPRRIDERVRHRILDNVETTSVGISRLMSSPGLIVACTALGASMSPILLQRRFDYCFVDEASQLTHPVCLGPLLLSDRFVLVGDPYQLPPLVVSQDAMQLGLDESLFVRLSEKYPSSVVTLSIQYRMCDLICDLANHLVYRGTLVCGSEQVANRRLEISVSSEHPVWLSRALRVSAPVVWIDTSRCNTWDVVDADGGVSNRRELKYVSQVVRALVSCGIRAPDIGVMTPYGAQLELIKDELHCRKRKREINKGDDEVSGIEVGTIDTFQGRDKLVVVVSWVRSNAAHAVGEIVRDWRRVNVAVTRSQRKLMCVGDSSTLCNSHTLSEAINWMRDRGYVELV